MNELIKELFDGLNNPQLEALHSDMMLEAFQHVNAGRISPGIVTRFVGLLAGKELERRSTAEGIGGTSIN